MTAILADPVGPAATGATAIRRFSATNEVCDRFFSTHADSIAAACEAMAQRFQNGGRLLVRGGGAQRSDVAHVVVEFVHPVIVGKRALPALGLAGADGIEALGLLRVLGRARDILMLLAAGAPSDADRCLIERARAEGLLTIVLSGDSGAGGGGGGASPTAPGDLLFAVPSHDPCIVQEAHEMLYHVLWELVHIFFEHRSVGA